MANEISIFNIGEHTEEMNAGMFTPHAENKLFDPRLKDARETKVCIIRPIPVVADPVHSMVTKRYYAINDQAGTIWFDSRTTFNKPAAQHFEFCPVSDLWAKLRNSKDPNIQGRTKALRLQTANYAYVQIVKFPGEEAFEGKIMPMRLPAELIKTFQSMSCPNEQELALGTKPVQPFDIMHGKNIKCTITGKMVDGTLMRDWKIETVGEACEASFPVGPNGAMIAVSKAKQEDIIKYLTEQQTEDLNDKYGYHEPTTDVKIRMKAYLQNLVMDVPGLREIAASYFPELAAAMPLDQNANAAPAQPAMPQAAPAQPAPQTIPAGDPMNANPVLP